MAEAVSREIRLRSRPVGMPRESDFECAEVPIPQVAEGEMLIRNIYMSVDPYMRGRMIDRESYMTPFQLGKPLDGGCVGQVVESKTNRFQVGDYVLGMMGWREHYVSNGRELRKVDPNVGPIESYLGPLGMTGLTAYVGLLDIGQPKQGETVFVSAAAGAVGSMVCQIARIIGCRVIASAGSDQKISWLTEEAGVDAAINYRKAVDLTAEVSKHCPEGVDVYFDNVGGEHLEAALGRMNVYGRVVLCGMISQYNATEPPASPWNLFLAVTKRLTLKGFIVSDHFDRLRSFHADVGGWIAQGRIRWKETVIEGIENAPKAFIGLFKGENFGKMLVRIGPDPAV